MPKYQIDVPGQGSFEIDSPGELSDLDLQGLVSQQFSKLEGLPSPPSYDIPTIQKAVSSYDPAGSPEPGFMDFVKSVPGAAWEGVTGAAGLQARGRDVALGKAAEQIGSAPDTLGGVLGSAALRGLAAPLGGVVPAPTTPEQKQLWVEAGKRLQAGESDIGTEMARAAAPDEEVKKLPLWLQHIVEAGKKTGALVTNVLTDPLTYETMAAAPMLRLATAGTRTVSGALSALFATTMGAGALGETAALWEHYKERNPKGAKEIEAEFQPIITALKKGDLVDAAKGVDPWLLANLGTPGGIYQLIDGLAARHGEPGWTPQMTGDLVGAAEAAGLATTAGLHAGPEFSNAAALRWAEKAGYRAVWRPDLSPGAKPGSGAWAVYRPVAPEGAPGEMGRPATPEVVKGGLGSLAEANEYIVKTVRGLKAEADAAAKKAKEEAKAKAQEKPQAAPAEGLPPRPAEVSPEQAVQQAADLAQRGAFLRGDQRRPIDETGKPIPAPPTPGEPLDERLAGEQARLFQEGWIQRDPQTGQFVWTPEAVQALKTGEDVKLPDGRVLRGEGFQLGKEKVPAPMEGWEAEVAKEIEQKKKLEETVAADAARMTQRREAREQREARAQQLRQAREQIQAEREQKRQEVQQLKEQVRLVEQMEREQASEEQKKKTAELREASRVELDARRQEMRTLREHVQLIDEILKGQFKEKPRSGAPQGLGADIKYQALLQKLQFLEKQAKAKAEAEAAAAAAPAPAAPTQQKGVPSASRTVPGQPAPGIPGQAPGGPDRGLSPEAPAAEGSLPARPPAGGPADLRPAPEGAPLVQGEGGSVGGPAQEGGAGEPAPPQAQGPVGQAPLEEDVPTAPSKGGARGQATAEESHSPWQRRELVNKPTVQRAVENAFQRFVSEGNFEPSDFEIANALIDPLGRGGEGTRLADRVHPLNSGRFEHAKKVLKQRLSEERAKRGKAKLEARPAAPAQEALPTPPPEATQEATPEAPAPTTPAPAQGEPSRGIYSFAQRGKKYVVLGPKDEVVSEHATREEARSEAFRHNREEGLPSTLPTRRQEGAIEDLLPTKPEPGWEEGKAAAGSPEELAVSAESNLPPAAEEQFQLGLSDLARTNPELAAKIRADYEANPEPTRKVIRGIHKLAQFIINEVKGSAVASELVSPERLEAATAKLFYYVLGGRPVMGLASKTGEGAGPNHFAIAQGVDPKNPLGTFTQDLLGVLLHEFFDHALAGTDTVHARDSKVGLEESDLTVDRAREMASAVGMEQVPGVHPSQTHLTQDQKAAFIERVLNAVMMGGEAATPEATAERAKKVGAGQTFAGYTEREGGFLNNLLDVVFHDLTLEDVNWIRERGKEYEGMVMGEGDGLASTQPTRRPSYENPNDATERSGPGPRDYRISWRDVATAERLAKSNLDNADNITQDLVRSLDPTVTPERADIIVTDAQRRVMARELGAAFLADVKSTTPTLPKSSPLANAVERVPDPDRPGESRFLQRHQGELVGAARSLRGVVGLIYGGTDFGSPVSARPLYDAVNAAGLKPSDALSPYGRDARRRVAEKEVAGGERGRAGAKLQEGRGDLPLRERAEDGAGRAERAVGSDGTREGEGGLASTQPTRRSKKDEHPLRPRRLTGEISVETVDAEARRLTEAMAGKPEMGPRKDAKDPYYRTPDGEIDEEAMIRRFVKVGKREMAHRLATAPDSGKAWYEDDIKDLDAALQKARPVLTEKPHLLKMFKAMAAGLSFGTDPNINLDSALRMFDRFVETGEIPRKQPNGKRWPGTAEWNLIIPRLNALEKKLGGWDKVAEWLDAPHTVAELRKINPGVSGLATDEKPGIFIIGPKGGPFYLNLNGRTDYFTSDLWFNRTWGRRLGTPYREDVSEGMRKIQAKAAKRLGEAFGLNTAGSQAVDWYFERTLWDTLGIQERGGSFSAAMRRALDRSEARNPEGLPYPPWEGDMGSSPDVEKVGRGGKVVLEAEPSSTMVRLGLASSIRSLPFKQQAEISKRVLDYTIGRALALVSAKGVKVHSVGGWKKDANPNVILEFGPSTPLDQVRDVAHAAGLGLTQDEVPLSRSVAPPKAGSPIPDDYSVALDIQFSGFSPEKDGALTKRVWEAAAALSPEVGATGSQLTTLGGKREGQFALRVFLDKAEAKNKTLHKALGNALAEAASQELGREVTWNGTTGWARVEWIKNDWEAGREGQVYRSRLEGRSYGRLDDFVRSVREEAQRIIQDVTGREAPAPAEELASTQPTRRSKTEDPEGRAVASVEGRLKGFEVRYQDSIDHGSVDWGKRVIRLPAKAGQDLHVAEHELGHIAADAFLQDNYDLGEKWLEAARRGDTSVVSKRTVQWFQENEPTYSESGWNEASLTDEVVAEELANRGLLRDLAKKLTKQEEGGPGLADVEKLLAKETKATPRRNVLSNLAYYMREEGLTLRVARDLTRDSLEADVPDQIKVLEAVSKELMGAPSGSRDQNLEKWAEGSLVRETSTPSATRWEERKLKEGAGPLRVYHGTGRPGFGKLDFSVLDQAALYGPGFYMTESPEVAGGKISTGWRLVKDGVPVAEFAKEEEASARRQLAERQKMYPDASYILEETEPDLLPGYAHKGVPAEAKERGIEAGAVYPLHANIKNPFVVDKDWDWDAAESLAGRFVGVLEKELRDRGVSELEADRIGEAAYSTISDAFPVNFEDGATMSGHELYHALKEGAAFVQRKLEALASKKAGWRVDDPNSPEAAELRRVWGDPLPEKPALFGKETAKATVNQVLQDLGYDGITHIGGLGQGKTQHRVWIAFPNASVKSYLNPGEFSQAPGDEFNLLASSLPTRRGAEGAAGDRWVHYGPPGLTTLSPSKFGSGAATRGDKRGLPVSYLYREGSPLGADVRIMRGKTRYSADLSGFNLARGERVLEWARTPDREAADRALLAEGYDGGVITGEDGREVAWFYQDSGKEAPLSTAPKGEEADPALASTLGTRRQQLDAILAAAERNGKRVEEPPSEKISHKLWRAAISNMVSGVGTVLTNTAGYLTEATVGTAADLATAWLPIPAAKKARLALRARPEAFSPMRLARTLQDGFKLLVAKVPGQVPLTPQGEELRFLEDWAWKNVDPILVQRTFGGFGADKAEQFTKTDKQRSMDIFFNLLNVAGVTAERVQIDQAILVSLAPTMIEDGFKPGQYTEWLQDGARKGKIEARSAQVAEALADAMDIAWRVRATSLNKAAFSGDPSLHERLQSPTNAVHFVMGLFNNLPLPAKVAAAEEFSYLPNSVLANFIPGIVEMVPFVRESPTVGTVRGKFRSRYLELRTKIQAGERLSAKEKAQWDSLKKQGFTSDAGWRRKAAAGVTIATVALAYGLAQDDDDKETVPLGQVPVVGGSPRDKRNLQQALGKLYPFWVTGQALARIIRDVKNGAASEGLGKRFTTYLEPILEQLTQAGYRGGATGFLPSFGDALAGRPVQGVEERVNKLFGGFLAKVLTPKLLQGLRTDEVRRIPAAPLRGDIPLLSSAERQLRAEWAGPWGGAQDIQPRYDRYTGLPSQSGQGFPFSGASREISKLEGWLETHSHQFQTNPMSLVPKQTKEPDYDRIMYGEWRKQLATYQVPTKFGNLTIEGIIDSQQLTSKEKSVLLEAALPKMTMAVHAEAQRAASEQKILVPIEKQMEFELSAERRRILEELGVGKLPAAGPTLKKRERERLSGLYPEPGLPPRPQEQGWYTP